MVNRGKHPMWESQEFPTLPPLSIPDHAGRDLARGTKASILDQLEEDVLAWEEKLGEVDEASQRDTDDGREEDEPGS
jgi:hypothetical protein